MTKRVTFRFYAELNDFLPSKKREIREHPYALKGKNTVKDAIESFGIPHTEIDLILINGTAAPFSSHLQHGDRVAVYPVFESFDISPLVQLRPAPLRHTAFILDVHLGKLARWLRTAGFDAVYQNDYDDHEIIDIALREQRIILTRDKGLLKHGRVTHGYYIRQDNPERQFAEVTRRFQLAGSGIPFSRCIHCNTPLRDVPKKLILPRLEPRTRRYYHEFRQCPSCDRVFWKGSHYLRMKRQMEYLQKEER